ncbi:10142_t:CDS:2 [Gigaspora margarita]|uniref:10142_t:CDS:1 n=2 Tax=Gigaspora TaxID=4873 RepID=A0ABN7VUW9_GIGMA|nr:10142_t:CDS:2 [Gigaspora margarita]
MGLGQSKNMLISIRRNKFETNKTERRKKFRSWSSLPAKDGNFNELWSFSNGGKRIHNNSLRSSKFSNFTMDEEVKRLERRHQLFKRIWQNNFSAPVNENLTTGGAKVLEIGCGPGTWTIEMAKSYQLSTFTGVDMIPLFPQEKIPENAKFLQANVLNGLPFLDDTFDFVYMGLLVTAFTITEWEKVIPELVRVTKQGGWIEFMESDFQYYNEGPTTARLTNSYLHVLKAMEANEKIDKNIRTEERSCFVGKWAGELGKLAVEDITKGWAAVKLPMTKLMRIKPREYDEIIATFAKEVEQNKTYFKNWRFFGQKIGTTSTTSAFNITTPSSWFQ